MGLSRARAHGVFVALLASAMVMLTRPAAPQFTSFAHTPGTILEGNWQSCREADGRYTERVYDHVVNGVGLYEVHMGPQNEFALFSGVQDEHRDHAGPGNRLRPYQVASESGRPKQRWEVPSLNLAFTVTLAGGSRTECESWFILLEPLKKPSH